MNKTMIVAGALLVATGFAGAAAAGTGCNGVVSQLEWGCAAWDNNNGPQFPHWKGAPARAATPAMMSPSRPLVAQGGGNIVASGGGNIVASGGGNVISPGTASNIVASGGGNFRGK